MAAQFLVALKAVPWGALLKNAPLILQTANALWNTVKGTKAQPPAGTDSEALERRVASLEEHDRANAELIRQMAEQVEALTVAAQVLAARMRIMLMAVGALALVSIALALIALWT